MSYAGIGQIIIFFIYNFYLDFVILYIIIILFYI